MKKKYLDLAKSMRSLADSIEALTESTDEQDETDVEKKEKPATNITFEDLRAVLAVITRDGKQQKVKDLITKYDAKKLSDVPEDKYQELLEEARKI